MEKIIRTILMVVAGTAVFGFILFAVLSVDTSKNNWATTKGRVTEISEGGDHDIVVILQGVRGLHYINRGIERGLSTKDLQDQILNKDVSLSYAKPGFIAGFSPMTDTRVITQIVLGNEVIFSEGR